MPQSISVYGIILNICLVTQRLKRSIALFRYPPAPPIKGTTKNTQETKLLNVCRGCLFILLHVPSIYMDEKRRDSTVIEKGNRELFLFPTIRSTVRCMRFRVSDSFE